MQAGDAPNRRRGQTCRINSTAGIWSTRSPRPKPKTCVTVTTVIFKRLCFIARINESFTDLFHRSVPCHTIPYIIYVRDPGNCTGFASFPASSLAASNVFSILAFTCGCPLITSGHHLSQARTYYQVHRVRLSDVPNLPYHTIPYHTIPHLTQACTYYQAHRVRLSDVSIYHTIPYHTIPYHTIPYLTQARTYYQAHRVRLSDVPIYQLESV